MINFPSIKFIFIYPILHFFVIYCCLLISSLLCPICLFYFCNNALYFLSLFTFLGMIFSLDILFSIFSHENTLNNVFFCILLKWQLSRFWGYTNKVVYSVQSSWPLTKQPQWRNYVYWFTIAELIRAPRAVCLTLWHSANMSVCVCVFVQTTAFMPIWLTVFVLCVVAERRLNGCFYHAVYLRFVTGKVAGLFLGKTAMIVIELTVNGLVIWGLGALYSSNL